VFGYLVDVSIYDSIPILFWTYKNSKNLKAIKTNKESVSGMVRCTNG
jgi:hypothetical protein